MNDKDSEEYKDLVRRYKERLKAEMEKGLAAKPPAGISREYQIFREEAMPGHLSLYEKLCNFSEKILHLKLKPENEEKLQTFIDVCHLHITPAGAVAFSFIFPSLFLL